MRKNLSALAAAVLTTLLLTGASVLGAASPAAAHDDLVSSYPQADSTIPDSPDEITLTFSGDLTDMEGASVIEVLDEQGSNIATDAPGISGASITQHLVPAAAGLFTVRWKVVSADGHPISGEYSYSVEPVILGSDADEGSPTNPNPSPSGGGTDVSAPAPSDTSSETPKRYGGTPAGGGESESLPLLIIIAFAAILGGGAFGVFLAGRKRHQLDRARAAKVADGDA